MPRQARPKSNRLKLRQLQKQRTRNQTTKTTVNAAPTESTMAAAEPPNDFSLASPRARKMAAARMAINKHQAASQRQPFNGPFQLFAVVVFVPCIASFHWTGRGLITHATGADRNPPPGCAH